MKIQPALAEDLVLFMNSQQQWSGRIERLYWAVSPTALDGLLGRVRTALIELIAEIDANMPEEATTPSAEVATNAITLAVTGKGNRINIVAPQGGSTMPAAAEVEPQRRQWLWTAGAVLGGAIAVAGLIFALMQVQGWSF